MRRILMMAAFTAAVAGLFSGCGKDDGENGKTGKAPEIVLVGGDIDAPQEILPSMSVQVQVTSSAPIAAFTVTIDSPALTPEVLAMFGLSQTLDLVNPGDMAESLAGLGFPVGDQIAGQTSLMFDISTLVPMIAAIYDKTSDHRFVMKVTDAQGRSTTETLVCHLTVE